MRPPRKVADPRNLTTYRRSRTVRLPDCDYAGSEIIHVTICANHGTPFRDPKLAQLICDSVEFYCRKLSYQLFGYCLTPDQLHVLLSPARSETALHKWLMAFKNYTGRMYANAGGTPPLWQRSAHDHVCRADETPERVVAYIANNPVRAGLADCWQDWSWTRVFVDL